VSKATSHRHRPVSTASVSTSPSAQHGLDIARLAVGTTAGGPARLTAISLGKAGPSRRLSRCPKTWPCADGIAVGTPPSAQLPRCPKKLSLAIFFCITCTDGNVVGTDPAIFFASPVLLSVQVLPFVFCLFTAANRS
jgi:hypothetical protein